MFTTLSQIMSCLGSNNENMGIQEVNIFFCAISCCNLQVVCKPAGSFKLPGMMEHRQGYGLHPAVVLISHLQNV